MRSKVLRWPLQSLGEDASAELAVVVGDGIDAHLDLNAELRNRDIAETEAVAAKKSMQLGVSFGVSFHPCSGEPKPPW